MIATSASATKKRFAAVSALGVCIAILVAACSTTKKTETTAPAPAATPKPQVSFANTDFTGVKAQLLAEVNKQRASKGLSPLKEDPALDKIALEHSRTMALGDFISDRGPDEASIAARISGTGYISTQNWGENVCRSYVGDEHLVDDVIKSWLNTDNANKNLFSVKHQVTGIGIVRTTDGQAFVTEDFTG